MEVLGLKEPNGISSGSTQTLATINSDVFLRILGRADAYLPLKIGREERQARRAKGRQKFKRCAG
jgi:hypothetical protein